MFEALPAGWRLAGSTSAVEAGGAWTVDYELEIDAHWCTRRARITSRTQAGARTVVLAGDGAGHWTVDGVAAPALAGCLDVDLEASAMTNTLPVHRLRLAIGATALAPAAYVRATDARVERLAQTYRRLADDRYDYESPAFDFRCELRYDAHGLVVDYPGIATRVQVESDA